MRRLITTGIVLFILLLGSFFLGYFLLPNVVSRFMTEKLNVPSKVENISLGKKRITLSGFNIQNPKGSTIKNALSVATINLKSSFTHYLGNPIILDEIHLKDVHVGIELSKNNKIPCNWEYIVNHIHSEKPHWYSIQRKALIKKLIIENLTIDIKLFGKPEQTLSPVPRLEFEQIDVEQGIPTNEISNIIISKMMGSIFSLQSIKVLLTAPFEALKFFAKPKDSGDPEECPAYSQ